MALADGIPLPALSPIFGTGRTPTSPPMESKGSSNEHGTIWGGSAGSGVFWLNGNDWIHVTLSPGGYNYSDNNV